MKTVNFAFLTGLSLITALTPFASASGPVSDALDPVVNPMVEKLSRNVNEDLGTVQDVADGAWSDVTYWHDKIDDLLQQTDEVADYVAHDVLNWYEIVKGPLDCVLGSSPNAWTQCAGWPLLDCLLGSTPTAWTPCVNRA